MSPRKDTELSAAQIEIIEAFLKFCYREGIEEVTQQKVAKAAGVALATFQYHFGKDRRDLTESALQWVAITGQRFTAETILGYTKAPDYLPVHAYAKTTFAWAKNYPTHASFWIYSHYLSSIQSSYRKLHSQFIAGGRSRVESLLYEHYGRSHALKKPRDVKGLANRIHTAIYGGVIVGTIEVPGTLREQEKLFLETLDLLLTSA